MGSEERSGPLLEHLVFKVAQGVAGESGPEFLESLVRNLAQALTADYVFAGELQAGEKRIVELAASGNSGIPPLREFDRDGTPFQDVSAQPSESFSYAAAVAELFPDDPIVRKVAGEAYVGAPLVDSHGHLMGMIGAVTRRRLEDAKAAEELVRIFSAPAARELERMHRIESLERQNTEVRRSSEEGSQVKSQLERDCAYLRDEIKISHPPGIGNSQEFRTLMNHVRRVAGTSGTVLIQGETGSGKELAARAIHNLSARRNRPLVKLDCAATPPELLDVELFGGLRDPRADTPPRIGRLDLADEGTLLLDEVGALPLELQGKLLRVIQQREFRPLGSPRVAKVDLRILATTNRDLEAAVREERFRGDLYQRLAVDPVPVPPLRKRKQDIPLLAENFLRVVERRIGAAGLRVSARMMSQMMNYNWPGNIRELEHLLFRAALSGPAELDTPVQTEAAAWPEPVSLHDAERHHVARTLDACNWVIEGPRGAAAVLKVPPSTLRSLMKRLQIQRANRHASG